MHVRSWHVGHLWKLVDHSLDSKEGSVVLGMTCSYHWAAFFLTRLLYFCHMSNYVYVTFPDGEHLHETVANIIKAANSLQLSGSFFKIHVSKCFTDQSCNHQVLKITGGKKLKTRNAMQIQCKYSGLCLSKQWRILDSATLTKALHFHCPSPRPRRALICLSSLISSDY